MGEVSDRLCPVELTVPSGALASPVMRLMVGWFASCHDLELDKLDDLQLALETLLTGQPEAVERLKLTISASGGVMNLRLAGLTNRALNANLICESGFQASAEWPLDIRVFLQALVDEYEVEQDTEKTFSVSLRKRKL